MTPEDFIDDVIKSIDSLVGLYSKGRDGPTYLGTELDSIGLTDEQRSKVMALIALAVGEATHSIICGIEGVTSFAGIPHAYKLLDENGNVLTGKLDSLLYERLEK